VATYRISKRKHRELAGGRVRVDLPEAVVELPEPRDLQADAAQVVAGELATRLRGLGGRFAGFARWLAGKLEVSRGGVEYPDSGAVERLDQAGGVRMEASSAALERVTEAHTAGAVFPERPKRRHFA
jgi:hypothetical protein